MENLPEWVWKASTEIIIWRCYICGEDLGDHATIAAGDCCECERIICENHFGHYDEKTGETICTNCVEKKAT